MNRRLLNIASLIAFASVNGGCGSTDEAKARVITMVCSAIHVSVTDLHLEAFSDKGAVIYTLSDAAPPTNRYFFLGNSESMEMVRYSFHLCGLSEPEFKKDGYVYALMLPNSRWLYKVTSEDGRCFVIYLSIY